MEERLESLKNLLESEGYTCVLSDGDKVFASRERGVKPLLEFIESSEDFGGFFAADKVVGKAAALLYALMGIRALYAEVLSVGALNVCESRGIEVFYDTLTSKIRNRKRDGICPMEQTVEYIDDPAEAREAIILKLESMSGN